VQHIVKPHVYNNVVEVFLILYFSLPPALVVVIHWTRQIKEVLATQDAMESADSSGPLEEIEFWRARCEDLSGLTTQLDQPGVIKVVKIIQKAKSSYLAPFQRLSKLIQVSII
jgi:dynein heavy chain